MIGGSPQPVQWWASEGIQLQTLSDFQPPILSTFVLISDRLTNCLHDLQDSLVVLMKLGISAHKVVGMDHRSWPKVACHWRRS